MAFAPQIHIIIPGCNCSDLTIRCLHHINAYGMTDEDGYYPLGCVTYVDNGSHPEELARIRSAFETMDYQCWEILELGENRGFTAAVNEGLKINRMYADTVLILNNDCFITPGTLQRLYWHFRQDRTIGVIGPLSTCDSIHSLRRGSRPQRFRSVFPLLPRPKEAAAEVARIADRERSPAPMVAFFCSLLSAEALAKVGDLDPQFADGLGADDDWCFRAQQAGYKIMFAADALCYHQGHQSFKRLQVSRRCDLAYQKLWNKHHHPMFARGRRS